MTARSISVAAGRAILRSTAGVHPHQASGFQAQDRARLSSLLSDPLVVAAGECGLDYYRNFSPPAEQRRAFALQLELAATHGKPLFLHQREAHADFLAMLGEHPGLARPRRHPLLHRRHGGARGLPRGRALDRRDRLDLRRAARVGTCARRRRAFPPTA